MPSVVTILSRLRALLEAENGWVLTPAADDSLAFQTPRGMILGLSPLAVLTSAMLPEASSDSHGVRFLCDLGVSAQQMSSAQLKDVLLFNFVLTNTLGGGLSIHPERHTIILSIAWATPVPEEDIAGVMRAMLALVRVADEIRETIVHGQSLCDIVSPTLPTGQVGSVNTQVAQRV